MNWIDFQVIADEQGLKSEDEIDDIEKIGDRFDISYTTPDGFQSVIEIEED